MKFTKEVRLGHRWVSNQDFKKFAPLFQEELTIDKMDRRTLDALCRIFKANPGMLCSWRYRFRFLNRFLLEESVLNIHETCKKK